MLTLYKMNATTKAPALGGVLATFSTRPLGMCINWSRDTTSTPLKTKQSMGIDGTMPTMQWQQCNIGSHYWMNGRSKHSEVQTLCDKGSQKTNNP